MAGQKEREAEKLAMLEAILFATNKPLKIEELLKISKIPKEKIESLLNILKIRYQNPDHGIRLSEIGGYRLVVKSEYIDCTAGLTKADLSRGLLRVLSIIAYHEPVKQADIVKIIGNRTYEYVHKLEQLGFVKSEIRQRTKILSTTPQFEAYFATRKEDLKKALKGTEQKESESKNVSESKKENELIEEKNS